MCRSRRKGRPTFLNGTRGAMQRRVLRTSLLGVAYSIKALQMHFGYKDTTLRKALRGEGLRRVWRVPEPPLYWPSQRNWNECYCVALALAYPTLREAEIARRAGIPRRTLNTVFRRLGIEAVWTQEGLCI